MAKIMLFGVYYKESTISQEYSVAYKIYLFSPKNAFYFMKINHRYCFAALHEKLGSAKTSHLFCYLNSYVIYFYYVCQRAFLLHNLKFHKSDRNNEVKPLSPLVVSNSH